jgi:hypothetical protein
MNKLLLSLPTGMSIRNIVFSRVIKSLLDSYELVIVSNNPYSVNNASVRQTIKWIGYPKRSGTIEKLRTKFIGLYRNIDYIHFWRLHKSKTMEKRLVIKKHTSPLVYGLSAILSRVWDCLCIRWRDSIVDYLYSNKQIEAFLVQEAINGVFVTSIDVLEDQLLIHAAKKLYLPVVALVHSWDNLPGRGSLVAIPDRLMVWNDIMRDQAMELHSITSNSVRVVGIPQYDYYKYDACFISRQEFFESKQIPSDRKLITFTCSAERVFPDEVLFIEQLWMCLENEVEESVHLVIRLHPTERFRDYIERFNNRKNVTIDMPSGLFAATYVSNIESTEYGINNFVNLMRHSDIVINIASTTTIDAAIFDTPVINIAYNIRNDIPTWNSAQTWYDTSHYVNISKTKGARLVKSKDQLVTSIRAYLEEPSLDTEGRQVIVEQQCGLIDGNVGERIMSVLKEVV